MATVEFRVGARRRTSSSTATRAAAAPPRSASTACPANLFVPTSDGGILFNYEQCFECGTCYMVCNTEGAITWTYPDGGHGVVFHRQLTWRRDDVRAADDRRGPEVGRPAARGRPAHRAGRRPTRAGPGCSAADRGRARVGAAPGRAAGAEHGRALSAPDRRGRDAVLREALAGRRDAAVRVDLPAEAPSDVGRATPWRGGHRAGADLVCCAAHYSLDRGSGSVPAFLAQHLSAAQALGLVPSRPRPSRRSAIAGRRWSPAGSTRRRRERLRVVGPGGALGRGQLARLRRAPLAAALAAVARRSRCRARRRPRRRAPRPADHPPGRTGPRARALDAPHGSTLAAHPRAHRRRPPPHAAADWSSSTPRRPQPRSSSSCASGASSVTTRPDPTPGSPWPRR